MSAGDTMQGRRVYDKSPHEFEPGDYGRWAGDHDNWYGCCPDGKLANLTNHQVIEHEAGDISVTLPGYVTVIPSILVTQPSAVPPTWHGHLERGIWREV